MVGDRTTAKQYSESAAARHHANARFKRKPVETYGEDRTCALCPAKLSRYNPAKTCGACTRAVK